MLRWPVWLSMLPGADPLNPRMRFTNVCWTTCPKVSAAMPTGQAVHGHGRLRRVLRFGRRGPGVEVDLAALGRMRFRKVD